MLALVLFLTVSIFAQEKINPVTKSSDQMNEWMKNIASDSSMRATMMEMMINKTKDNPEEMMVLVNLVLSNTEMHKMIMKASKTGDNNSLEMPGMMNESKKVMEMTETQNKPKKK